MRRMALVAAVWALGLLPGAAGLRPGALRVAVLDVGQGDAVLLTTPHGRRVLVDGGPDRSVLAGLGAEAGGGALDLVVLTHPHADHMAGLTSVVATRTVRRFAFSGAVAATAGGWELLGAVRARGIPVSLLSAPTAFELDGMRIDVLAPERPQPGKWSDRPNDDSVVLRASYGATRILLTGDLELRGEAALVRRTPDLRADIYKAGHHGSKTSSSAALLRAVRPQFMPVSVGERNAYRHPSPEILERATAMGVELRRTDLEGSLEYVCTAKCCRSLRGWKASLPVFPWEAVSC